MPDSVKFPIVRDSLGTLADSRSLGRHQPVRFSLDELGAHSARVRPDVEFVQTHCTERQTECCEGDGGKKFMMSLQESW